MSAPKYQLIWRLPDGEQIGFLDTFTRLDMAYSERTVGAMDLVFPARFFKMGDIFEDQIIEVYRSMEGGPLVLEGERAWFIRDWSFSDDYVTIKAFDSNYLLDSRIVAYASGAAQAKKQAAADDFMKAVLRENMGSLATDTARNLSGFTIQSDFTLGPVIKKEFSRDKVLPLLQSLYDLSVSAQNYITFDVVCVGPALFEFRTYKDRRGANRGRGSGDPFVFSKDNKNLTGIVYEESHADERTFAYAGGKGEGVARAIASAASSGYIEGSKWNRREVFFDGRATSDLTVLEAEADGALQKAKPKIAVSGNVVQAPGSRYALDYTYGSTVVISAYGYQMDCRLSTVHLTVNEQRAETVDIKLRAEG